MKLPIQLNKDSREPIYHQIEKQLEALIAGGQLKEGDLLPSIRMLSKDLGVSVITTKRAYQNLEYAGLIETVQGKGTFVAKVDEKQLEQTKETAIKEAFDHAIQTARHYDYTDEQMRALFEASLKKQGGRN